MGLGFWYPFVWEKLFYPGLAIFTGWRGDWLEFLLYSEKKVPGEEKWVYKEDYRIKLWQYGKQIVFFRGSLSQLLLDLPILRSIPYKSDHHPHQFRQLLFTRNLLSCSLNVINLSMYEREDVDWKGRRIDAGRWEVCIRQNTQKNEKGRKKLLEQVGFMIALSRGIMGRLLDCFNI